MKIISFDVGIKNLAYCIFEVNTDKSYTITDWGVLDLINKPVFRCCAKQKKKPHTVCGKKATYIDKQQHYYCKSHAKSHASRIPTKELTDTMLKRYKVFELKNIAATYGIQHPTPILKSDLLSKIKDFREEHFLKHIVEEKVDTGLVTVSINLAHLLDTLLKNRTIDCVLIENQISKIASTMKTVQGMITQYFVMINVVDIHYISSFNKLKMFIKSKKNYSYKDRKHLGIQCALNTINETQESKWLTLFENHKKKDDLADSFLQGLWYINMKLRTT